jgi:hypothetical protein
VVFKVTVVDEQDSSYGDGRSRVEQRSLFLQDASDRPRMKNLMEWVMPSDFERQYSGKLLDKIVSFRQVNIRNVFAGIARLEGMIEFPNGEPVKAVSAKQS